MFKRVYSDRRVLVTGHTGFKGSWISAWLLALEARVSGLALDPNDDERLFTDLGLAKRLASDHRVDLRDAGLVARVVEHVEPDFIFHLAELRPAPRSRPSPVDAFATNLMGTLNLLEGVRRAGRTCIVVVASTDACYERHDGDTLYHEADRLGSSGVYGASKTAMELVLDTYRNSIFGPDFDVRIGAARMGDVIGGGEWGRSALVADAIRALRNHLPAPVRRPMTLVPWQHVLEPISGLLWLALVLERPETLDYADARELCGTFNFGPSEANLRTESELIEEILSYIPGRWAPATTDVLEHETHSRQLSTKKAREVLGWCPVWDFGEVARETATWYLAQSAGKDMFKATIEQIRRYEMAASTRGLALAR
ncbi:MAG: CDP-glucose 4,6-dehydratase [Pirellulales bacterium]